MEYDRADFQGDLEQIFGAIQAFCTDNTIQRNPETGFYDNYLMIWSIGIDTHHPEYHNELNRLICETIDDCEVLSSDDEGTLFSIRDCEVLMTQIGDYTGSDIEFKFVLQTFDNDTNPSYSDNEDYE